MTELGGGAGWVNAYFARLTRALNAGVEAARKAGQAYLNVQAKAATQKAVRLTPIKLTPTKGGQPEDKSRLAPSSALIGAGKPLFEAKPLVEARPLVEAKPLIETPQPTGLKWKATAEQRRVLVMNALDAFNKTFSAEMKK